MAVVMAVVATTMIVIMVMVMVAIMAVVVVICRGRRRNECRRESTQQHAEPDGTADQQPLHGFLPVKTDVSRGPNLRD
jgi:heme/copper-type cytochrome/quinol oxidase subunit 2